MNTPATVTPITAPSKPEEPTDPTARAPAARAKPVRSDGLPPAMQMALHHYKEQKRVEAFDEPLLRETKDAVLRAVSTLGDEKGFAVPSIVVTPTDEGAEIKVELSVLDPMGLDAPARRFLDEPEQAGLSAAMFMTILRVPDPRPNEPERVREFALTGLQHGPRGYLVRLYDLTDESVCVASAALVRNRWHAAQRRNPD